MAEKRCSSIIVYFSDPAALLRCLQSIVTRAPSSSSEVIIVNNSCGELPFTKVKSLAIKIINNTNNVGFARACNQGAAAACGQWLLFLNPDTELTDDFVQKGIDFLVANPATGMLGPALIGLDNHIQVSAYRHISFSRLLQESLLVDRVLSCHNSFGHSGVLPAPALCPMQVDWVCGAAMLISKEVFDRLNGFNTEYFLYFEDVELCDKIRRSGRHVIYFPQYRVRHFDKQARDLYNEKFGSVVKIVAINRSILTYWKNCGYNMFLLKSLLAVRTTIRLALWAAVYPFTADRDSVRQRLLGYWQVLHELLRGHAI
jgi:N-acetylglucosaminyl-diphospho-decaprenol L-rhamnosyltransferase